MKGYCPIDDEPLQAPRTYQAEVVPASNKRIVISRDGDEDTECNYVVLFFIVGVISLAMMDSMQK